MQQLKAQLEQAAAEAQAFAEQQQADVERAKRSSAQVGFLFRDRHGCLFLSGLCVLGQSFTRSCSELSLALVPFLLPLSALDCQLLVCLPAVFIASSKVRLQARLSGVWEEGRSFCLGRSPQDHTGHFHWPGRISTFHLSVCLQHHFGAGASAGMLNCHFLAVLALSCRQS